MSRRTKILIAVILIVVVLVLIYWLFLRPKYVAPPPAAEPPPAANVNVAPPPPLTLPPVNVAPTAPPPEVTPEEKIRSDLSRLAAAFAERFGSYSNQGNFENLLDLKPLMTQRLQDWTDDVIAKSRETRGDVSVYFGMTTKAISTNIISLDEEGGQAKVIVSTQKREASGSMTENIKVYYQDLELVFLKVGEEWKVDEATWK